VENTMKVTVKGREVELGTIVGKIERNCGSNFVNRFFVCAGDEHYTQVLNNPRVQMFNGMLVEEAGFEVPELATRFGLEEGGTVLEIVMYDGDDETDCVVYLVKDDETFDLDKIEELFMQDDFLDFTLYMNNLGYTEE
jgi:hypothetical protein